ncbi:LuxR family transcriptional regulator [Planosporangium mesophilum]|uniref:LuxR family transcriptional regulator n=1 Tax=Planosporangium mesophilum TaxID=689768 RepID=A0A8J3TI17_9ACTN|nr:LuxR family transcriptional regulator [Planosporangium mesophilum]
MEELARLTEAAAGATGRGLILGGAAGIGKSRLLREAVATLDTERLSVWSATANTATAGLPLGSLSQVLPADQPAPASTSGLLRWAVDALRQRAAGRPVVLAIDDGHLLDPLSATLIYYLAHNERTTILATVRTGEPVPDPVRALWTDDLVERVELGPLTQDEVAELLSRVFGGPVDSASVDRLCQLSQGNALLLRELVLAARAGEEITSSYGVWRWTGRFELIPTLTEVIDARIGQLTTEVRDVLELVAFGEPIGLQMLVRATDAAAVEQAEERQLIRVVPDDRRANVRLAHPLYAEVVRQRCPVTRFRRLLAELADLVDGVGSRRRDDLLRVAVWRLDSDTARDPRQLLDAARQASAGYNIPLAIRLARAAVNAGAGFEAALTLGTLLMFADQPAEALAVLDLAGDLVTDDRQRADWLSVRASVLYWGLAEECAAARLSKDAEQITEPAARAGVRAVESIMHLHRGEHETALELAQSVLDDAEAEPAPRALAAGTVAHLQAARGAFVQTLRAMAVVDADAPRWRLEAPYIQLAVELARGTAMILAGDLGAVRAMVAAEFAGLADAGDFHLGAGYVTLVRAQAARLRGRLPDAARFAGQAAATLAAGHVYGALANAERAHVAALSGDHALAARAMAECDACHRPTMNILYPWLEQARAWVAICSGEARTGVEVLSDLIGRLRADGFAGYELHALHDLVRLGRAGDVVERLAYLAGVIQGPLAPVMAWHARAAASADGGGLLGAAEAFADLGLSLYAAEAAAGAIPLLRAARSPQTTTASELLTVLLQRCEGVKIPTLVVARPALTTRERQIAKLAAAGVPSKEIADKLYLSSRTVDNHLLRVYAKLGVAGRAELAGALRALPTDE